MRSSRRSGEGEGDNRGISEKIKEKRKGRKGPAEEGKGAEGPGSIRRQTFIHCRRVVRRRNFCKNRRNNASLGNNDDPDTVDERFHRRTSLQTLYTLPENNSEWIGSELRPENNKNRGTKSNGVEGSPKKTGNFSVTPVTGAFELGVVGFGRLVDVGTG